MAQQKSLTVNFFGRDVTLSKALDGIKKNTFATSNVLEQGSKKATYVLGALTGAAIKFAKAAADDEKGAVSLANTLKTVTGASAAQIANVETFIGKTELLSTVADDKLRPAFDTLVRAQGSVGKAQKSLNLALEIASKTGADVTEVADAMAKAERGQFKALVNLTKIQPKASKATAIYGTQMKVVNGQLVSVQKTLGKTQKSTESLESYYKRLGKAYNGSIAAQSGTAAFKFAQFQRAMDRTQETLGYMLLPYLKDFSDWLIKIEPWVTKHKDAIGKWAIAIGTMAVGIKALNGAYKAFKITEAIANFILLGKTATAAGADAAAAGAVAAAGWAWLAAAVSGTTALGALMNNIEKKRKAKLYDPNKIPSWSAESNKFFAGTSMSEAPHKASGGIVMRRTPAIVGEGGPEAIIPLSKMNGMGSGVTIINYIQGSVVTEKELSLKIRNDMAQLLRRKGINPSVLGV